VMRRATARTWKNLARERLGDVRPKIPLGKRFWPLLQNETSAIAELFKASESRRLITLLKGRRDDAEISVLDAGYWMKGCSSFGRLWFYVAPTPQTTASLLITVRELIKGSKARVN